MRSWVNTHGQEAAISPLWPPLPISQQLNFFLFVSLISLFFIQLPLLLLFFFSLPLWPPSPFILYFSMSFPPLVLCLSVYACFLCMCVGWVIAFLSQHTTESRWEIGQSCSSGPAQGFSDSTATHADDICLSVCICVWLFVVYVCLSKLTSWPCIPLSPPSTSRPTHSCLHAMRIILSLSHTHTQRMKDVIKDGCLIELKMSTGSSGQVVKWTSLSSSLSFRWMAACWIPFLPPSSSANPPPPRLATWWRCQLMKALRQRSPTQRRIHPTCSLHIKQLGSASGDTRSLRCPTNQGLQTKVWRHTTTHSHLLLSIKKKKKQLWLSSMTLNSVFCPSEGKLFTLGHNPSMGSVDSDIGYDMGSMQSDLGLLEDPPSLSEVVPTNTSTPGVNPAPYMGTRPANPAMAALTSQHREAHNRSPISFREGRRASDTSLTQGQNYYCHSLLHISLLPPYMSLYTLTPKV